MNVSTHAMEYIWKSKDNALESVLPTFMQVPGTGLPSLGLGGKCFYPLSYVKNCPSFFPYLIICFIWLWIASRPESKHANFNL